MTNPAKGLYFFKFNIFCCTFKIKWKNWRVINWNINAQTLITHPPWLSEHSNVTVIKRRLCFLPQQSLDAGWWNPQKNLARICLLIWWARLVLHVSFDHWRAKSVMESSYSPCGVYKLNKWDIASQNAVDQDRIIWKISWEGSGTTLKI